MLYDTLDTVYDASLPENPEEFEVFQNISETYFDAFPEPQSEVQQVEARVRSMHMTAAEVAERPDVVKLDNIVLGYSAQPKPQDQPKE